MKILKLMLTVILCLVTMLVLAQPPRGRMNMEERKENIEAMKIAFLTRKLSLNSEEAKKFWPVYNEFTDEIKKLRDGRKDRMREARDEFATMNDKDVEKLIDGEIGFRQQELDVVKSYHGQFKQVLPMKKVALLYRAEEEFKKELLERIKERREGGK